MIKGLCRKGVRGKLFSTGLYLCICSVSFGGGYWPVRAVLYLYRPRVSMWSEWLGAGQRGAVGVEAALGKQGLSTRPGTSAQVWTGGTSAGGWGGQGCRHVFISQRKKKKMDEMVSFPLSSFFFLTLQST